VNLLARTVLGAACVAAVAMPSAAQDLTGAGATFPYPIYNKWFSDYAAKTGVKINYQSIGSGGGVRQISEQTVDFGASDAPMSDEELAKAKGGALLHVPTVLGAVVITYNVSALKRPLKLDGITLADIYLGKITKWNDPRIAALNKGTALPASDILVVHRSDGSGTTYVFTDYLSRVSTDWATKPGKGKDVQWPVGLGAKGNDGVSGQVKELPGSIGYVELAYAKQNKLAYAEMKNAAGHRSGHGRSRRRRGEPAGEHGLPHLHRQFGWQERLSDLVVHMAARVPPAGRRQEGQEAHRLREVGADGGREVRRKARLRAAATGHGEGADQTSGHGHARFEVVPRDQSPPGRLMRDGPADFVTRP